MFCLPPPLAEQTFEPYAYVGNNPIMFIDPTEMSVEGAGAGKPYQGGIRVYQAAEASGDVPGGSSRASEAFNVGNYNVLPNYVTNDNGEQEFSHYTASVNVNVITGSGKQSTPRVDYVFGKKDLKTFKNNVRTFEAAANLMFGAGTQLSKGQINILNGSGAGRYIGEQFASPSNWLAALSGLALFTRPSPNLPAISMRDQGRHIIGSGYIEGRSVLTSNPETLLNGINGRYPILRANQNRVTVDFGKNIDIYYQNGQAIGSTRYGTVHYGKKGSHIVPANPQQY